MAKVITTGLQHSGASAANITLDSSKNVTCENNLQVDGNVTVTGTLPADKLTGTAAAINGSNITNLPAANLTGALPAISGANLTGITSNPPPFRNLMINGAMNVHQRIATGTMQTGTSGYTADRWRWWDGTGGVFTWGQVTESPAGFRHSHLVDCAISGSPSGDEYSAILYKVEANDLTHLKYNTSDAQSLTLSFWVRSNLTGDWAVSLRKKEGTDRNITKTYTINAANTWEKKTITFPGDTSGGGIDMASDGINEGLRITFCAQAGANNKGGTGADSWHNWIANKWFEGHDVDLGSSASNDWYITGVQLEVGDTATDFEHRSYGEELDLCKRYFQVFWSGSGGGVATVANWGTAASYGAVKWEKELRTTPTITVSDAGHFKQRCAGSDRTAGSMTWSNTKSTSSRIGIEGFSGSTDGQAAWIGTTSSSAKITLDAEI